MGCCACWLPLAAESSALCSGALVRAPSLQGRREGGPSHSLSALHCLEGIWHHRRWDPPQLQGGIQLHVGWELPFRGLRSWHRSGISCQPCWQVSLVVSCSSLVLLLLGTSEQPGMGHVPSGTCWKPAWQPATTPRWCHSTRGLCDCGSGSKAGGLCKFCTRGCRKGSSGSSRTCHHPCQDTQE